VFVTTNQGDCGVMHTKQVPLSILSLHDVSREAGEPQLVHTAAGRILLLRVSMLSGMETSAGKVFRICKLFPNFQDTPWSICATPAVRNVHSDWQMTHFSAANSAKLDRCVGLCDVTNSADDK
jgi:hypothetical protein